MFHNILVGVDGSAHSRRAVQEAADIARSENAELTLISAYNSLLPWPAMMPVGLSQDTVDEFVETARDVARGAVEEAAKLVPDGVPVQKLTIDCPPADAILDQTREGRYDLVVVGSRGRGDVASILLGSVSHRVVHESRVPVLVVHVTGEPAS